MNKFILILIFGLFSTISLGQTEIKENKRTYIFAGTAQGVPFLIRGSRLPSNTKPYDPSLGYLFKYYVGVQRRSKSGKGFSNWTLNYRSDRNVLKNVTDVRPIKSGQISQYDCFNFVSLSYQYSRYLKPIKGNRTFLSAGIEFAYVLNRSVTTKYTDGTATLTEKASAKEIPTNIVATSSPTFLLSCGIELDKPFLGIGRASQISFDLTYDYYMIGLSSVPPNQNLGVYLNYKLLF